MRGDAELVIDQHLRVIAWVAPRVGEWFERLVPGIGIGLQRAGELIAGIVFTRVTNVSAEVHLAVTGKHRGTPELLRIGFDYPFNQLGLKRLTALVREDNRDSRRLVEHLGFVREGLMRRVCTDGANVIVYGMLREECRWVKP